MASKIDPATLESGSAISMLKTLNIQLKEIGVSHALMEVTVSDIHKNYLGGAHGGLIATLIDTVSFFPKPLLPSGKPCTTTNLSVTYVRPAAVGDQLTARAELLHLGRRMASVAVTVKNQHGKLVAHGTTTLMIEP
ncbi:thioesterase [Geoanaerobacter pelophilus]|uniref:Thioesterase n=1 Tax=Geoanaerobacter pelophilus TaxID=60036 RepID=A0ABQ0MN58_9BACT|nr:PaaI family thioesterase [Geoanaerobacter pelophilus]GAW68482.1 thioesterase [Geoanaerobacter pelophilus]